MEQGNAIVEFAVQRAGRSSFNGTE